MLRHLLLLALLALFSSAAASQPTDALTGKRVRVTAPAFADRVIVGTVTAYTQEGLRVREEGAEAEHSFPLRAVQRLDVFRGGSAAATASRRMRMYGFIGFALGALAGPVIALFTDRDVVTTGLLAAGGGAAVGAGLGAVSGTAHPTEQWSWVMSPWGYDPRLRPDAVPAPAAADSVRPPP